MERCVPARPPITWLVTACRAPDGSYWAVQSWQRTLPVNTASPSPRAATRWELRLSHWSGPVPRLEVRFGWTYSRFHQIFGRFTYRGLPVYGFSWKPTGEPLDDYGRNIYVDTLDSAYGKGWHRENGFLTHQPTGRLLLRLLSARQPAVRARRALPRDGHGPRRGTRRVLGRLRRRRATTAVTTCSPTRTCSRCCATTPSANRTRRHAYDRPMPGSGPDGDDLRDVMRRFPSGVAVVTVNVDGTLLGQTVSALVSLSLDPPLVGISIARQAQLHELLREAGGFAVSLLAGGQEWLSQHFARSVPPIAMWHGVAHHEGSEGAPLLAGAIGWLECRLRSECEAGDHTLFVGEVLAAELGEDAPPLVHVGSEYRALS